MYVNNVPTSVFLYNLWTIKSLTFFNGIVQGGKTLHDILRYTIYYEKKKYINK